MVPYPRVVWITQWYPHEGEPYAGDFIQRHARAVALYMPVHVIACFPHTHDREDTSVTGNLTETVIYFKAPNTNNKLINKMLRLIKWQKLLRSSISRYMTKNGKPDFIHCHITLNAGFLGLWAKLRCNIPYLITEHWSGYMAGATNGFKKFNPLSKRLFHTIVKQSLCITTVSRALANEMQSIEKQGIYIRIPNVVDESVFKPAKKFDTSRKRMVLHVSTFSKQKNIPDMLVAFDKVAALYPDVEFHLVGPTAKFREMYQQYSADSHYVLHGEIPQVEIATLMEQCEACVLYSHYETFGCVLIEMNAMGKPVIVSDIPVLREIIHAGRNGVLVPPDQPDKLAEAIITLLANSQAYNSHQIIQDTLEKFSFPVVGKHFFDLYKSFKSQEII